MVRGFRGQVLEENIHSCRFSYVYFPLFRLCDADIFRVTACSYFLRGLSDTVLGRVTYHARYRASNRRSRCWCFEVGRAALCSLFMKIEKYVYL